MDKPVALTVIWLDGGVMNHVVITTTELSIDQQKILVEIISDQSGPHLTFDEFSDQVLHLFEDISGFEVITDSDSTPLINQLWRKYHGPIK